MKGQMMLVFSAIESARAAGGAPVNFKFIIEGQEEIGSPGVREALIKNQHLFNSDFVLNLDAGMIAKDKPTIVVGLRGLAYFELTLKGFSKDLHSGVFGGVVSNPLNALCQVIAGMKDVHGFIQLPGFYDDVLPLSAEERESLKKLGMDENYFLEQTSAKELWGENGYSPVERAGARPTLDVHGIMGGYTGEGPKTVIPAQATAKLSMRLVPRQTPDQVEEQLVAYLEKSVPAAMDWELKKFSSEPASISDRNFYATRCFARSLEQVWGKPPVYERSGGSIPMVGHLQEVLQLESILSGFSLPEDNIHSPNEKMDLEAFEKGIKTVINFLYNLAEENGQ
jgi:acetylornithine deacetylase/succinyl-diaminopimelate desuccinylase-like protein